MVKITKVSVLKNYRLEVAFDDGVCGIGHMSKVPSLSYDEIIRALRQQPRRASSAACRRTAHGRRQSPWLISYQEFVRSSAAGGAARAIRAMKIADIVR